MPDFRNARPMSQPEKWYGNPSYPKYPGKGKFVEARLNGGMITMLDPADIPTSAVQIARNARVRFDRTQRRPGTILLTPEKPDSEPVLGTFYFKKNDGTTFFFRFTPSTIFSRNPVSWDSVPAGAGGSLMGTINDRFQSVVAFDRFIFSNNGVDVIQEIDTSVPEYKPLGNAPGYKYITGFYNRIVGANRTTGTPNAVEIGWSAEGGITGVGLDEWNPLVDETAGNSPLVDSPSDVADYITGLFGFTNVMIVLREQSIWLGTKQPIPTNPFNFYNAFPGLGCDAPDSAVITLNGITWVDTRSGTVWLYTPGGQPQPIGRSIEADLMRGLSDPAQIFASYAPIENEYTVCIPQTGSRYVLCWTYNFRTQAWVQDEYESISSIDDIDLATAVTTIDELIGVIEDLEGTIDELSPTQEVIPTRVFGRTDGEIIMEDRTPDDSAASDTDPVTADALSTGVYETELLSKSFTLPTDDMYIAEIRIEYLPLRAGNLKLEYSRDGGRTISTLYKEITTEDLGKAQILKWVKQVKARRYAWRLTSTSGQFHIIGYEVHVYEGAESNS